MSEFPLDRPARFATIRRTAAGTSRLMRGGAWLFALSSLVGLGWVLASGVINPGETTALYQAMVPTEAGWQTQDAWGLAYDGRVGMAVATGQAALVLLALMLSTRSGFLARMVGHLFLLSWASVWMASLSNLVSLDGSVETISQASAMAAFFGCTLFRAGHGMLWGHRSRVQPLATMTETDDLADMPDELEPLTFPGLESAAAQSVAQPVAQSVDTPAATEQASAQPAKTKTKRRLWRGLRRMVAVVPSAIAKSTGFARRRLVNAWAALRGAEPKVAREAVASSAHGVRDHLVGAVDAGRAQVGTVLRGVGHGARGAAGRGLRRGAQALSNSAARVDSPDRRTA